MLLILLILVVRMLASPETSTMDLSFLERLSELEHRFKGFSVAGTDAVRVSGSLRTGLAVNIDEGVGLGSGSGGGLLLGACCFNNGNCSIITELECSSSGGNYQGDGTV